MSDLALGSIVDAVLGALLFGSLSKLWDAPAGRERLKLRLLAFVVPPILPFLFLPADRLRHSPFFECHLALFDSRRLDQLSTGPATGSELVLVAAVAAGLALLIRDMVPILVDGPGREPEPDSSKTGDAPLPSPQRKTFDRLSASGIRIRLRRPPDGESGAIFCRGLVRPAVWVDSSLIDSLEPAELEAAIAHELSHAIHRDGITGWAALVFRAFFFWNPAVQITGRAVVRELEIRADEEAVSSGPGSPNNQPLARALARLDPSEEFLPALSLRARIRRHVLHDTIRRRRLLLEATPRSRSPIGAGAPGFAAAGFVALLFFVM